MTGNDDELEELQKHDGRRTDTGDGPRRKTEDKTEVLLGPSTTHGDVAPRQKATNRTCNGGRSKKPQTERRPEIKTVEKGCRCNKTRWKDEWKEEGDA